MEELIKNGKYEDVMCIYKIENKVTGKVYIGSTNNFRRRMNSHIRKLKENTHKNVILQNSWNIAKDKSNFYYEIVELVNDESFLPYAELYYIEKYRRINGVYNVSNPLEEVSVIKRRDKKNTSIESKDERAKKLKTNKMIKSVITSEFEYMLSKLKEKLDNSPCVEFLRILQYIERNISIKEFDEKEIENNLIRVLKSYDLTVYNFESDAYPRELLNKYGIYDYKRSIINKALAKKIYKEKNEMYSSR